MKAHTRKKIAPIIITLILLAYYTFYFKMILNAVTPLPRILLGVIPILFAAATIGVCIQRIKEINGGEEDDLGKY